MVRQLAQFQLLVVANHQAFLDIAAIVPTVEPEVVDANFDEVAGAVDMGNLEPITDAPSAPPALRLGQIAERLGMPLTAAFLSSLGFEPAARDKAACLYHEHQFGHICAALHRHISAIQAKQAA